MGRWRAGRYPRRERLHHAPPSGPAEPAPQISYDIAVEKKMVTPLASDRPTPDIYARWKMEDCPARGAPSAQRFCGRSRAGTKPRRQDRSVGDHLPGANEGQRRAATVQQEVGHLQGAGGKGRLLGSGAKRQLLNELNDMADVKRIDDAEKYMESAQARAKRHMDSPARGAGQREGSQAREADDGQWHRARRGDCACRRAGATNSCAPSWARRATAGRGSRLLRVHVGPSVWSADRHHARRAAQPAEQRLARPDAGAAAGPRMSPAHRTRVAGSCNSSRISSTAAAARPCGKRKPAAPVRRRPAARGGAARGAERRGRGQPGVISERACRRSPARAREWWSLTTTRPSGSSARRRSSSGTTTFPGGGPRLPGPAARRSSSDGAP